MLLSLDRMLDRFRRAIGTQALEKRRLKGKYFKSLEKISCAQLEKAFFRTSTPRADRYKLGLALIVEGVITAPDNNVGIDEDTLALVDDLELFLSHPWAKVGYTIHEFSIVMQAMPELGERFGERVGERSPRLLCWTSTKQPCTCTPYCVPRRSSVICLKSPVRCHFPTVRCNFWTTSVGVLPDHSSIRRHQLVGEMTVALWVTDMTTSSVQGPRTMRHSRLMAIRHRRAPGTMGLSLMAVEKASGALPTPVVALSTSGVQGTRGGPTLTREDVEGMLYNQRILFEMRLRTVKLEIMQHLTEEFARLRDFISTLVPSSSGTSTSAVAPVVNEPNLWDDPHEDGESRDEQSPQYDDRAEDDDMQDMNDPGETVPTLPNDDNEEGPSTHDVTEVDSMCLFSFNNLIPQLCGVFHTERFH
ncbi:Hypothetical predicted protein [Olea europaea subsp. europaea]|uniref:DUF1985 domain-containing protein n=1 Tax=Olea europaea subsp. europaea TaxID=158383 RepID=A0A8S0S2K0_OLEEU|nr:Hypothetical predicted protein [Olea europaea subsp. europaea]